MILETTTAPGDPGLGVIVAIFALLGAAWLSYRRDSGESESVTVDGDRREFLRHFTPSYYFDSDEDDGGPTVLYESPQGVLVALEVEGVHGDDLDALDEDLIHLWLDHFVSPEYWRLVSYFGELSSSMEFGHARVVITGSVVAGEGE